MEEIHMITDVGEMKRIIENLQSEIIVMNGQYEEKKLKLQQNMNMKEKNVKDTEKTSMNLLRDKKRFLEAEVEVLKMAKPSELYKDPAIRDLIIEKEFNQLAKNLHEMIALTKKQKAFMEKTLKRLDVAIARDTHIAEALQKKIADSQEEAAKDATARHEKCISDLKTKIRDMKKKITKVSNAMAGFFDKYFPNAPSIDDDHPRLTENGDEILDSYCTLSEIIEILVNAYLDSPHKCYVEIDERWWPPYLEMLIRHEIAIRHPRQPNKIRLEAFGTE